MGRRIGIILAAFGIYLGYFGISPVSAQTGSQFCVRSFQDSNGNGVLDAANEPLLTRGVGIELLDSNNVVIASALLERSPNASDGVVCFQNLTDGEYSVFMSSADFTATTSRLVRRTVSASALPVVIEFGAQRIGTGEASVPATAANVRTPEQQQDMILRLSLSTVGTVLMLVIMLIVGTFIYVLRSRQPAPRTLNYSPESVRNMDPYADDVQFTNPATQPYTPAATPAAPASSLADTGPVRAVNPDDDNV